MKKSLVVPALILALFGLGAAPATASETPGAPASSVAQTTTVPSETSPRSETTSLSEESALPDDAADTSAGDPQESPQTPSSPSEAGNSTGEPDDDLVQPTPTAPSTGGPEATDAPSPTEPGGPSEPDAPSETDSPSTPEPPAPIDAAVTVSSKQISESDLYFDGLVISVSGLEPGDLVTNSLNEEAKVAQDSEVVFEYYPDDILDPGTIDFTITIKREGVDDQVIPAQFEILADEAYTQNPLTLSTDSLSVSEFLDSGVGFTGDGFEPGETAIALAFSDDTDALVYADENLTVTADGVASGVITSTEGEDIVPGTYFAYVAGESSFSFAEFTLTADAPASKSADDPAPGSHAGPGTSAESSTPSGSSLPRTGAELTGLSVGIALTVAGIAAVLFSRRRRSDSTAD